jgi:regulatory protein
MWGRRRQQVSDEDRIVKDPLRARERTMNRAVKLLAAKPRSVGELRERLLEKLWTNQEIVDAVIDKLKEYKYLDDEQFARDLAISKLRQKPQGKRKLQQSLSRKQISKETLDRAITTAFETVPENDLIDTAIQKRVRLKGLPETRDDVRKFYEHLMRQGFAFDLIREKMSELRVRTPDNDGLDQL